MRTRLVRCAPGSLVRTALSFSLSRAHHTAFHARNRLRAHGAKAGGAKRQRICEANEQRRCPAMACKENGMARSPHQRTARGRDFASAKLERPLRAQGFRGYAPVLIRAPERSRDFACKVGKRLERRRGPGICPVKIVRVKGLEPIRTKAPDPKSGLATNYNTPASAQPKLAEHANIHKNEVASKQQHTQTAPHPEHGVRLLFPALPQPAVESPVLDRRLILLHHPCHVLRSRIESG